jgi:hypothetical protein
MGLGAVAGKLIPKQNREDAPLSLIKRISRIHISAIAERGCEAPPRPGFTPHFGKCYGVKLLPLESTGRIVRHQTLAPSVVFSMGSKESAKRTWSLYVVNGFPLTRF